jgi:cytochrome c-type biogenesis protein CcmH/NrfG
MRFIVILASFPTPKGRRLNTKQRDVRHIRWEAWLSTKVTAFASHSDLAHERPETGLWGWHLTLNGALISAKDLQDSSSPRARPGGNMNAAFKPSRWILSTALFALSLTIPGNLPAQAPAPANAPAPAPAATSPSAQPAASAQRQPTDEQVGDSLTAHQHYQAAIAAYSKAPEMTADIWNKMGIDYQMMFNSKDASRCYKESLKLEPRNPQVLNNLGTVFASTKDFSSADHLYRKALKIDPHSALILKNLGTNLLAQHKYDRGWAAYQQALAIDPHIFSDNGSPSVQDPSSVQARGAMNYYMAAGCARAGYADCALQYLRMALDEGFTTRKKVANDSEFASLHDNPDFKKLLEEQQQRTQ